jgi:hypothetical protein
MIEFTLASRRDRPAFEDVVRRPRRGALRRARHHDRHGSTDAISPAALSGA